MKNCPDCGCFLEEEEINYGVDEDDFHTFYKCNNKKCIRNKKNDKQIN